MGRSRGDNGSVGPMTERHDYIDALRGYAILLVILVHSSQAVRTLPPALRLVVDQGARGVQLFFVASALTLMMSWHGRDDGALRFYARRLFRIAPMFWLATLFFALLERGQPHVFAPNGTGPAEVALTASFLHGWHPATINSIVPGGWSVADEVGFYVLFPFLAAAIRGWKTALAAFVLAMVLASGIFRAAWHWRAAVWPGQPDALVAPFVDLWLPTQLPVFMVGFVLFFAIRNTNPPRWVAQVLLAVAIGGCVYLAFHFRGQHFLGITLNQFTRYAICFALFAYALAKGAGAVLNNRAVRYMGKISFSAYLWHLAILHTLQAGVSINWPVSDGVAFLAVHTLALLATTVVGSSITYALVERPMIRLGARLIAGPAIWRKEPQAVRP